MNLENINWQELEERYISSNLSMRKLAEEYGADLTAGNRKKLQKKIEYRANKGSWKHKRMQYRAGVVNQALEVHAEDEVELIRQMREQERREIKKALQVTDSIINSLLAKLQTDNTTGEYLFPELNQEENLALLEKHSLARERYQKMLYRSFDIAERSDINMKNVNMNYADLMSEVLGDEPTTAPDTL